MIAKPPATRARNFGNTNTKAIGFLFWIRETGQQLLFHCVGFLLSNQDLDGRKANPFIKIIEEWQGLIDDHGVLEFSKLYEQLAFLARL